MFCVDRFRSKHLVIVLELVMNKGNVNVESGQLRLRCCSKA